VRQAECGSQQDLVWFARNDLLVLIAGYHEWLSASRLRQMVDSSIICRLANEWTMGRNNKLDLWKMLG
jgi:hypothetical protein